MSPSDNGKHEFDNPTVLLVRHGKTAFNQGREEDRLKGVRFDLPLTPEGQREAEKDGQVLSRYRVAEIRHSDMKRSKQTADAIGSATGVRSTSSAALDPWDVGYLSGHRRKVAASRIVYYILHPQKPVPGGDPYEEWFDRFSQEVRQAMTRAVGSRGKAQVLVLHSCGVLASPVIVRGGEAEEVRPHTGDMPEPGRVIKIERRGGQWRINMRPEL